MRTWYRLFLLVSLLCLVVALYQADYLRIPELVSAPSLTVSFLLLFAAFLVETVCWKAMLAAFGFKVSGGRCLAGMGLSVFGKFVPGKVWTIAGRGAYIAQRRDYPLAELTVVSLQTQFADLWTALAFGTIGLSVVGGFYQWGWSAVVLWLLLSALIFSPTVQHTATAVGRYVFRREITVPKVKVQAVALVFPWFALACGLLAAAFYLLARGLVGTAIPWSVGLGFPLAGALGIMAIFAPGGLGVREAVLTGYLVLAGVPLADATTVAVASRLWFLVGEFFMFAAGLIAHRVEERSS